MKMTKLGTILVTLAATLILAHGQQTGVQAQQTGAIIRLDPALDEIVPADARVEKAAGGLSHVEGPVWVRKGGYLLLSDMDANSIYEWDPAAGRLTVFLENSGFTSMDGGRSAQTAGGAGSNGITVDPQWRIVFCTRGSREVVRL
jgi:gluconolactonase